MLVKVLGKTENEVYKELLAADQRSYNTHGSHESSCELVFINGMQRAVHYESHHDYVGRSHWDDSNDPGQFPAVGEILTAAILMRFDRDGSDRRARTGLKIYARTSSEHPFLVFDVAEVDGWNPFWYFHRMMVDPQPADLLMAIYFANKKVRIEVGDKKDKNPETLRDVLWLQARAYLENAQEYFSVAVSQVVALAEGCYRLVPAIANDFSPHGPVNYSSCDAYPAFAAVADTTILGRLSIKLDL